MVAYILFMSLSKDCDEIWKAVALVYGCILVSVIELGSYLALIMIVKELLNV